LIFSIWPGFEFVEASLQITQGAEAALLVFVDPALGDLPERDRIKIMELLPASPKRNDEVRFGQEGKMFGYGLAGHIEVLAKFTQRLAIVAMQPIEERSSARIGQSFKDVVHSENIMQSKGCM
jgi:hypothetical protein